MRVYDRALSATEIQTDMNTAVAPPPADTTLPKVAISTPVTGQTVSATMGVVATATDDIGVASVQFLLDGANFGSALTAAPYTVTWDTKDVDNGTHMLTAVVRDLAGNANVSADVAVTVSNADTTSPNVAISGPAGGSTRLGLGDGDGDCQRQRGGGERAVPAGRRGPWRPGRPHRTAWRGTRRRRRTVLTH